MMTRLAVSRERRRRTAIEAARRRVVLTPANSPELDAARDDLYVAVVGKRPRGSVPLKVVAA